MPKEKTESRSLFIYNGNPNFYKFRCPIAEFRIENHRFTLLELCESQDEERPLPVGQESFLRCGDFEVSDEGDVTITFTACKVLESVPTFVWVCLDKILKFIDPRAELRRTIIVLTDIEGNINEKYYVKDGSCRFGNFDLFDFINHKLILFVVQEYDLCYETLDKDRSLQELPNRFDFRMSVQLSLYALVLKYHKETSAGGRGCISLSLKTLLALYERDKWFFFIDMHVRSLEDIRTTPWYVVITTILDAVDIYNTKKKEVRTHLDIIEFVDVNKIISASMKLFSILREFVHIKETSLSRSNEPYDTNFLNWDSAEQSVVFETFDMLCKRAGPPTAASIKRFLVESELLKDEDDIAVSAVDMASYDKEELRLLFAVWACDGLVCPKNFIVFGGIAAEPKNLMLALLRALAIPA